MKTHLKKGEEGGKANEPFKPQYYHPYSPHYSPYISYVAGWENLIKNQNI